MLDRLADRILGREVVVKPGIHRRKAGGVLIELWAFVARLPGPVGFCLSGWRWVVGKPEASA